MGRTFQDTEDIQKNETMALKAIPKMFPEVADSIVGLNA
jgi:hypothetical protein